MKPKLSLRSFLAIAGSSLMAISSARGQSLYWDSNGTTAGSGDTPTGTWGTDNFWNTDSTGGAGTFSTTTSSTNDVFFSAGTDAVNPYTVGLNAAIWDARLVTFEDGTVTLNNGTLRLNNGGGITVASSTVTGATISSNLTLSGSQTFNVAASRTLTLDTGTFTRSAGATLNIQGAGIVNTTMTGLSTGSLVNGIIGPWATFGTGASTTYATINGSNNIVGLDYSGGANGTSALNAAALTTSATTNFTFAGGAGTLGGNSFNTLRYTGSGGAMAGNFTTNGILNVSGNTLTFSGAVTSGTGEMVVNAASGGITLSSTLNNNGNLVTVTGGGNTTFTAAISGSGGLYVNGVGTTTLSSNTNSFTGQLTVANGTLIIGSINNVNANGTLGNSNSAQPIILGSSGGNTGTLRYTGNSAGSSKTFALAPEGTGGFEVTTAGQTLTISGLVNGSGGLTKTGAGNLSLSNNANQFTGNILISNGKLALGAQHALWKSAYDTTGSTGAIGLDATGQVAPVLGGLAGNVNLATAITAYGSVTTLTLNPQIGSSVSYSGDVSGASLALSKTGKGTQILTATNSYGGATNIFDGTLALSGLGTASGSAFTVRGGTLLLDNSGGTWVNRIADTGTASVLSLGSLTLTSDSGTTARTETVGATTFAVSGKVTINNNTTGGSAGTTLAMGAVTRSAGAAIDFVGTGGTLGSGANSPNVTSTGAFPSSSNGILGWATVDGTLWAEDNGGSIRAYSGTFVNPTSDASDATKNSKLTGSGILASAKSFNSLNIISNGVSQSFNLNSGANLTLNTNGGILKSGTEPYAISSGGGNITAGAALNVHVNGGALTISAPLNTAILGIAKGGTGDLILSGTRAGTMSGAFSIAGGQLEFQGNTTTITGAISGAGGITVNLNAGQILSFGGGANKTYSGPTIVKGGILRFGTNHDAQSVPSTGGQTINGSQGQGWTTNVEVNGGIFGMFWDNGLFLGSGPGQIQFTGGVSGITMLTNPRRVWTINNDANFEVVWGASGEGAATGFFNPSEFVMGAAAAAGDYANIPNRIDLNGATRTVRTDNTTHRGELTGVIRNSTGTAGLTKTGAGELWLGSSNTYNGATTISQGTLQANSSGSLGNASSTNTLIFDGGTLRASGTITSPSTRAVTMTSTGIFDNNSQAISIAGNIGGAGGLIKNGAGTLTLSGTNNYAGVTTLNAGTLLISGTHNTGAFTVNAGTLQFAKQVSLYNNTSGSWTAANINVKPGGTLALNVGGSGEFTDSDLGTLFGNILVANTSAQGMQGGTFLSLDTTNGGLSTSAAINDSTGAFGGLIKLNKLGGNTLTLTGPNTYTGNTNIAGGTLEFASSTDQTRSGIIGGAGALTKSGTGILTLSAPNIFTGATTVSAGTVALTNALALQNSAYDTTGSNGTTIGLDVTAGLSSGRLTLGGLAGNVDLASAFTAGFTGSVTNLTLNPQTGASNAYSGIIANGTMSLTKTSAGTQILQGANAYTGATNINAGVLTISGASGSLASTAINLNGGTFTLDNSSGTGNSDSRISNSATVAVNGNSALNFTHNNAASTNYAETIGTLSLQSGMLTYTGSQAAASQTSNLHFGTLSRTGASNTSTVNFAGTGLGTNTRNTITFGTGVTDATDLGPWAVVNGADFARYSGANGIVATTSSTLAVDSSSSTTNFNTNGASITFNAALNPSMKTLLISSGTVRTTAINGNTVSVGGISSTGNTHVISGTGAVQALNAGDALYVHVGANTLTFNSVIQNVGAGVTPTTLVKSGSGVLNLSTATTNTFSGGIVLNAGELNFLTDVQLGNADNDIIVNGTATLRNNSTSNYSMAATRSISINDGAVLTINGGSGAGSAKNFQGELNGNGTLTLADNFQATFSNIGNLFTGAINLSGTTIFASLGDSSNPINFNGTNFTWSGGPKTFSSRSFVSNTAATGSILSSGTGAIVIQQNLAFSGAAGARTLTLGGSYTGGINQFDGNIADGPGSVVSLTRSGGGTTWALSGTNTYSGATTTAWSGSTATLTFQGMQALSPYTSMNMTTTLSGGGQTGATYKFLDDSATPASRAGVNLNLNAGENANTASVQNYMYLFVGNNSAANGGNGAGGTTGSTIQLGNMNFNQSNIGNVNGAYINLTGANGYKLQLNDVNINLQAAYAGNWNVMLQSNTAPLTVAGNVQQAAGATSGNTTLILDGTNTESSISGNILNSADGTPRVLNLTKSNTGRWTLTGANTYTGTTTISNGTLSLGVEENANVSGPLGKQLANAAGTILMTGNGILQYSAANQFDYSGRFSTAGSQTWGIDTNNQNATFATALQGTSSTLTKIGIGTLTLTANNTYTGVTSVNGGTLLLDKTGTGAVASTSGLTLGGGTFQVKGATSGATAQTMAALTVNNGDTRAFGMSRIVLDSNGGSGTTLTLASSSPTRTAGGTVNINLSSPNTVLSSTLGLAAAAQTNTQAVLGYATVTNATGTGFAANVGGNIVRYTGAATLTNSSTSSTTNYALAPSGTTTSGSPLFTTAANPSFNTLSIDTSGATGANFLSLNGTVTLTQRALLMTGGNDFTIQGGTQLSAATHELIVHQAGAGTLTINSLISSTSGLLTKAGAGTLVVGGNNTYTGATRINEGILRLGAAGNGTNTPLGTIGAGTTVFTGGALDLGGITLSTSEALTLNGTGVSSGGALTNSGAAASYSGAITLGSNTSIVASNGLLTLTGGITTVGNNVTFGGAGNTTVSTTAISGAGGLIKDGEGTLTLDIANTYTGATVVNGGVLELASGGSTASGSAVSVSGAASTLIVNGTLGGTLTTGAGTILKGAGTILGDATISGVHSPGNSPEVQSFGGNLTYVAPDVSVTWELIANTTLGRGTNYDGIDVGGDLDFEDPTVINLVFNLGGSGVLWTDNFWDTDQSWVLYDYTGGSLTNLNNLSVVTANWLDGGSNAFNDSIRAGGTFTVSNSGTTVLLNYTAIPEPSTALLSVIGTLALLRRRR